METSKMKNMIVLSNPPSNLIEEAIIILKSNKKVQELKYIENRKNNNQNILKEKNYIIKEAESVILNYMNKIEDNAVKNENKKIEEKYKKIKKYSVVVSILFVMTIIKILF